MTASLLNTNGNGNGKCCSSNGNCNGMKKQKLGDDIARPAQETPLLDSLSFKEMFKVGNVQLKLDNTQPTGSFKYRAMLNLCTHLKREGATKVVASSGGNAGVAAAYACQQVGLQAIVVVPETTRKLMIDRLNRLGAKVIQKGQYWNEANELALEILASDPNASYCPPFDHPKIWEGNSTVIDELYKQTNGIAPDVFVLSVGGGGLAAGVFMGLKRYGGDWAKMTVVLVETEGAPTMHEALKAGKPVTLPKVDTIAQSLAARKVADGAFELALEHQNNGGKVVSILVSDKEAVDGIELLLNEHRFLVEPACGCNVTACFKLAEALKLTPEELSKLNVVIEVCGGSAITMDILNGYKQQFKK